MAAILAVFDLDGTIVRRDSFLSFLLYVFRRHPRLWWQAPSLGWAVFGHFFLGRSNHWLKAFFLRRVAGGLPAEILNREADAFAGVFLRATIRPGAAAALQASRDSGQEQLLLSASPDFLVERFGAILGFASIEATRAGKGPDGRITGELIGGNCHGPAKVERVREHLRTHGPFGRLVAYSDHHSDIPLLDWADEAVCVHPTPALAAWARNQPKARLEHW